MAAVSLSLAASALSLPRKGRSAPFDGHWSVQTVKFASEPLWLERRNLQSKLLLTLTVVPGTDFKLNACPRLLTSTAWIPRISSASPTNFHLMIIISLPQREAAYVLPAAICFCRRLLPRCSGPHRSRGRRLRGRHSGHVSHRSSKAWEHHCHRYPFLGSGLGFSLWGSGKLGYWLMVRIRGGCRKAARRSRGIKRYMADPSCAVPVSVSSPSTVLPGTHSLSSDLCCIHSFSSSIIILHHRLHHEVDCCYGHGRRRHPGCRLVRASCRDRDGPRHQVPAH